MRWWRWIPGCAASLSALLGSSSSHDAGATHPSSMVDLAATRLGVSSFYPGLYYPNAPSEIGAALVQVIPGTGFGGVDIALVESGGTVIGRVDGPDGPVGGLLIQAFVGSVEVAGRTDGEGLFSLEGVPAGSVSLRFSSDHPLSHDRSHAALWLGGSIDPDTAVRVEVTDSEVQDIGVMSLERGVVLGGLVETSEGVSLEDAIVQIEEIGGAIWSVRTGPSGEYAQGGLHGGAFRIRVTPPAGPYLLEYFGGARTEAEAVIVAVSAPGQRLDLNVEVDRGGEIRGQIRSEGSNEPYPDFAVEARESITGHTWRAHTDHFGFYQIEGLPSGSYLVYVPRLHRFYPGAIRAEDARAIHVVEGAVSGRVDVIGFDLGTCQLGSGSRGRIEGILDANLGIASEIRVSAYSEVDTVEATFEQFGSYGLDCVPPGSYRVRFLPKGGYRTQYHARANDEPSATIVSVDADTVRSVDYRPERSGWIAGRVTVGVAGVGLAGVRVNARSNVGGIVASDVTGADGSYRVETRSDGSGLPAGLYRVNAESTLVADPDVTPVLQPALFAEVRGDEILISALLDRELAWTYRIWRRPVGARGDFEDPILEGVHPARAGSLELTDRPAAGTYRYELEADLVETVSTPRYAWSNEVEFEPRIQSRISAYPDPWSGVGSIRLRRSGLGEPMRVSVVTVTGRQIASWDWRSGSETAWNGTDASGRAVPSGVYFLGLQDEVGRLLDVTTIVIER